MGMIQKMLVAALVVGGLGVVIYIQRGNLAAEKDRANRAEQGIGERDKMIKKLQDVAAKNRQQVSQLQADREKIAATLSERERQIEKLQHDDAAVRNWADTPLPGAIARMRDHPALTGAAAYHQRLRAGDALQPAGHVPND